VRFVSFLSGEFTTIAVMNPPEKNLEKRTFVHWGQLPEKRWPLPVTGPSQHSFIIVKSGESEIKI
jgi:hypothetical protein